MMALKTFKYVGTDPLEVPSLDLRIPVELDDDGKPKGTTFQVPEEYAARFEAEPGLFVPSTRKTADVVPTPEAVASVTGQIPVQPAPAA